MDGDRAWMQVEGINGRRQEAYKKGVRDFTLQNCEIESAEMIEANSDEQTQLNMGTEPKYFQLWIKTKRHADGRMVDEAENILQKFRDLHSKEIEEKGSDELTIDQAYGIVLGNATGYARGLGRAHPMQSKKMNLWRSELQTEVELLREREKELRAETEKKEHEALEREAKIEEATRDREAKLRDEFRAEMAKMYNKIKGSSKKKKKKV